VHALVKAFRDGGEARAAAFGRSRGDDPIPAVAEKIAGRTRLVCFDELQVTDIADAMILGRLFEALFERGVVLVATSNRHPDDLYKDGLNRQLFLPFIELLKQRTDVVRVAGAKDHRLERLMAAETWLDPITPDTRAAFEALWRDLAGDEAADRIEVHGRTVEFPRTSSGQLRASFEDLCGAALGPQDYVAIARRFHTVFLENVPTLRPEKRNEAKRFVTLIDALYEARGRLVALAEAEPEALYPAGHGAFEFERTVSRLQEMRSHDWLERERDAA
jgi:cell division protein ZapE